jgi:hypothetical protein
MKEKRFVSLLFSFTLLIGCQGLSSTTVRKAMPRYEYEIVYSPHNRGRATFSGYFYSDNEALYAIPARVGIVLKVVRIDPVLGRVQVCNAFQNSSCLR